MYADCNFIIKSAVLDFCTHKRSCSIKWLFVKAKQTILKKYDGFEERLDFSTKDLSKAIQSIHVVAEEVTYRAPQGPSTNNKIFNICCASHTVFYFLSPSVSQEVVDHMAPSYTKLTSFCCRRSRSLHAIGHKILHICCSALQTLMREASNKSQSSTINLSAPSEPS